VHGLGGYRGFCVMSGGVLNSYSFSDLSKLNDGQMQDQLSFAQSSDSHRGFNKAANPDVVATLKTAVHKINAAPISLALSM
jgi:3',5'-cyclic-AMP phosphodiesterase